MGLAGKAEGRANGMPVHAQETVRIIGFDPGLGRTGFGVLDIVPKQAVPQVHTWGLISTTAHGAIGPRLCELRQDLLALLKQIKPDIAAVESLFFFKNVSTAIPVAQARGVLLLCLAEHNIPVVDYTPMQVKQTLTGYGKASKPEINDALVRRLALEAPPRPDDAADGLALALTHWQSRPYHQLTLPVVV